MSFLREDSGMISRRFLLVGGAATLAGGVVAVEFGRGQIKSPPDRAISGVFASAHMRRQIRWSLALPRTPPSGIVFCLHGYSNDHTMAFRTLHIPDVVAAAGAPLAVAACDGGEDSYWHPRRDGTDAMAMFFEEFLPLIEHQTGTIQARAVMGWSMGGYGALLFAEQHPELFKIVVATSPALWTSPAATAPGAFDDAADFRRWNVFDGIHRLAGLTVRVDCGTQDPFVNADRAFVTTKPDINGSFTHGSHDAAYWRRVAPAQIAMIASVLTPK